MTPMMAQWKSCKEKSGGALLFFRLGDFYEAFEEDAAILSKELDLVLTKRQETPMAGVPAHMCEVYIDKLIAKGYRVAIAEQMEDPQVTKGIVKREIIRTVTPGTLIQSNLLTDKSANFVVSIHQINDVFGLGILDLSTADFRVMEVEGEKALHDELTRLQPKEIIVSSKSKLSLDGALIIRKDEWCFNLQTAQEKLCKHFSLHSLDGLGLFGMNAAISAAGALFMYVQGDLQLPLSHIQSIKKEETARFMAIDSATQRHLEIVFPLHPKGESLLGHLDHTVTPMGGRLLRYWVLHPLLSAEEIHARQDRVASLLSADIPELKEVRDLERLIMRIETGYSSPRDLSGLRFSLEPLPAITRSAEKHGFAPLPDLSFLADKIKAAIVDAPPLRLSEGGIFRAGFNAELDELRGLKTQSVTWMASYQARLREELGIKTLKVGFTAAFGYFIEVSRGQSDKMSDAFQRRQTLVSSERYTSAELKEYEHKILSAESRMAALETHLFHELRKEVAAHATTIRQVAHQIAELDTLLSLATIARIHHYVRPTVDTQDLLTIIDGRHPILDAQLREQFISNDVLLSTDRRLLLITGPNMAGKSTYIRQVALLTLMAQIGSFIPAKSAHIGIVDKLFSRIGASDDLARGQSTFMVEMTETASILHSATDRSLIILDEIGRGTSTYDGIAIAWAVAEYLLTTAGKRAKTLFATHYLELTQLEEEITGAINLSVAVQETSKGIVFLHKIVRGAADKSYGIHVAKLAGLPKPVVERAEHLLSKLHAQGAQPLNLREKQLELF
ncbi:MAG: DNA mismatch repair protein MutS [Verrucomicrobia bacterium]|nr:DNA mismatch repair protein MutS [Verrucomicrobiota bacterium]